MSSSSSSVASHYNLRSTSSSSSSSSSSSIQATDSSAKDVKVRIKQVAEKSINQIIQNAVLKMPSDNAILERIQCGITLEVPNDPVVTTCGHLFDRKAIEEWKDENSRLEEWGRTNGKCPECRAKITKLIHVPVIKNVIEALQKENSILTCSNFKKSDQKLVDKFVKLAKSCIKKKDYEPALTFYSHALEYTKSSEVYAAIPQLYKQLEKPEKATLSYLYLSLYQIQEGKIPEAIETLKQCGSDTLEVGQLVKLLGLLVKLLELKSPQFSEEIVQELFVVSAQTNMENRVGIYKQIIANASSQIDKLEAYKLLIPLIKDTAEKQSLLLQATDLAKKAGQTDLEKSFSSEIKKIEKPSVISQANWDNAQKIKLPPYPKALKEFLEKDGNSDKHVVVPFFPNVEIDGAVVPTNLECLGKLDKSSQKNKVKGLDWFNKIVVDYKISTDMSDDGEFKWLVFTKDIIPGTGGKSYDEQKKLLTTGYEIPGIFEAAYAMLLDKQLSQSSNFSTKLTRCKECTSHKGQASVGFDQYGLNIQDMSNMSFVGIMGMKVFYPDERQ